MNPDQHQEGVSGEGSSTVETVIDLGGDKDCHSDEALKRVEGEESESESESLKPVCRICHLSGKETGQSVDELQEIGCGCKGELGVAHVRCSEAWFRVKGNQSCEICGETAKNIVGESSNDGFMEVWEDRRSNNNINNGRRWQLVFKLVLVCVIIAFAFPWVFHVTLI